VDVRESQDAVHSLAFRCVDPIVGADDFPTTVANSAASGEHGRYADISPANERSITMTSKLWEEFKSFAFKGNMIDLAVAVVIGGAFGDIIKAIVNDVIMPLVGYVISILHIPSNYTTWHLGNFMVGHLLAAMVNFLIIASAVFIVIVKMIGAMMQKATASTPEPGEPTTKECPLCLSVIPIKARKCAHCTADLA